LIDRGEDSAGVIKFVREGGYQYVLGNHELLMQDAYDEENNYWSNSWIGAFVDEKYEDFSNQNGKLSCLQFPELKIFQEIS